MVVIAQYLEQEDVLSDSDTIMAFSGDQTVCVEDEKDPEVIWDSGSTITLAKERNFLEDIIQCKVTMCSNGSKRKIEEQGN